MSKKVSLGEVTCNICGEKYYYKGKFNEQVSKEKENVDCPQDWVHEFPLGNIGYGSFLDMSNCTIHICDNCLKSIFKNMEEKPIIYGSSGLHIDDKRVELIEEKANKSLEELPLDKMHELLKEVNEELNI